ncbi:uncharacterized protein AMSG_04967 [Thecamonas trahens ATCC 50062]|uniref:Uncharacterized protein n=1 Tax=Thecamonas trahens ATCC 50062 TaxID=461836 RepID=A0A0L0DB46_THETB|nr:hypothetical protein AMSG_04967 [Thecamonas trahens ATCC 50062]KNC48523.1 hypothetical protein AMSG_04967 [Thecamonas trahens ATCC 50062]|eukprot:XP_013758631.1 hypothetical protein AMSG_04967 [Thecamonas trahens ATCC 50062]
MRPCLAYRRPLVHAVDGYAPDRGCLARNQPAWSRQLCCRSRHRCHATAARRHQRRDGAARPSRPLSDSTRLVFAEADASIPFCVVAPTDTSLYASTHVAVSATLDLDASSSAGYTADTVAVASAELKLAVLRVPWPRITRTAPTVSPASSSAPLILHGSNLEARFDVSIESQIVPATNISASNDGRLLLLATSPTSDTGYLDIIVSDPITTAFAVYSDHYFTDDCPAEGSFGKGLQCAPCPSYARCPGGDRMWPKEGYWTPSEFAGFVVACSSPASRCSGGRASRCGAAYSGNMCAECAPGFYRAGTGCAACTGSLAVFSILITSNLAFWTVATAAALLASDKAISLGTQVLLGLAILRNVAKTHAPILPSWMSHLLLAVDAVSLNLDVVRPGCEGLPGTYTAHHFAVLSAAAVLGFGSITTVWVVGLAHPLSAEYYRHRRTRVGIALAVVLFLPLTQLFLNGIFCISLAQGSSTLWVVGASRNMKCLAGEHIPIFISSLLGLLGYSAKLGVFAINKLRELRRRRKVTFRSSSSDADEAHAPRLELPSRISELIATRQRASLSLSSLTLSTTDSDSDSSQSELGLPVANFAVDNGDGSESTADTGSSAAHSLQEEEASSSPSARAHTRALSLSPDTASSLTSSAPARCFGLWSSWRCSPSWLSPARFFATSRAGRPRSPQRRSF